MAKLLLRVVVGFVAGALVNVVAAAEDMGEVTVQASRVVSVKDVGRNASGLPIQEVSLSYGVRIQDLDLASDVGVKELKKRVTAAARVACFELGRQYPDSLPKGADCTRQATDKAMVRVNELIAAAAKKPGK